MKNLQPSERLELFLKQKGWSYDHFANIINVSKSGSDKYVGSGKKSTYSAKILPKLSMADLNISWYLTGEGEMLLSSTKKGETEIIQNIKLPDLKNMTTNEIRELLKWFDENHDKLKSIVSALDK
ncbi:MAG: hypothetical protein M9949_14410 [Candidatus Kapabacteria bacterium]|nr:hypothetical protein [Candidatus Kapabacteria bacterium]